MAPRDHRLHFVPAVALLVALVGAADLPAQPSAEDVPDLATLEVQLDESFEAALAVPEDQPLRVVQAWGQVLMGTVMLERRRDPNAPREVMDAAREAIFERWRRERPDSAGPELMKIFEIRDPVDKRAAILALHDRRPDNPLVLHYAAQELLTSDQTARATEMVEGFAARNPSSTVVYPLLLRAAWGNETRRGEIFERWSRVAPGGPDLTAAWLQSETLRGDQVATRRLLDDFFAQGHTGWDLLGTCRRLLEIPEYAGEGRACVAKVAGDPNTPDNVTRQAVTALAGQSARDGNWSGLLTALDDLPAESRASALINAASQVRGPDRCDERLELLATAASALGTEANDASLYRRLASTAKPCAERTAAQTLLLELLDRAPTEAVDTVVSSWLVRTRDRWGWDSWSGELPAASIARLEARRSQEGLSENLFRALDLAYRVLPGHGDRRIALLGEQHRASPGSLDGDQTVALAVDLLERDEIDEAVLVLEERLARRTEMEVAGLLWRIHREAAALGRAAALVDDLSSSDDRWTARVGGRLAARAALADGDPAAAEELLWQVVDPETNTASDLERELVATAYAQGEAAGAQAAARRLCEETQLAATAEQTPDCTADLLRQAGLGIEAASLLEQRTELPDDMEALQQLSRTARSAGNGELEERTLRRILELDPRSETSWTGLGGWLGRQGRIDELEALIARSRERFDPPPVSLYVSLGKALVVAGEPRRGIDALKEARSRLPDTAQNRFRRNSIAQELRTAYEALGRERQWTPAADPRPPARSFPVATPEEPIPTTADGLRTAAEALLAGRQGRYAPDDGRELMARAAALGDAQATFRLALLHQLRPQDAPAEGPSPLELYRRSVNEVERRAATGEPYAQYLVGTAALVGLGGPTDPETARRWLEPSAAGGESWALHNLAWATEAGRGFPNPDPVRALDLYAQASERGNVLSMIDFARLTLVAGDPTGRCPEGLDRLERSAAAGNATAATRLGQLLFYGLEGCVERDLTAARPWLEAAISARQDGSPYILGLALVLTSPNGTARERGLALLEGYARQLQGALAAETLALLYGAGIGVARDPEASFQALDQAARLGSDGFVHLLRTVPESPLHRQLRDAVAARLETLAVEGDGAAAALLARLQSVGLADGPEELTVDLARQGAAQGESLAMRILWMSYRDGAGVAENPDEERRWLRRCAEAGDSFCQMFLSQDLRQGRDGVEQDVDAAVAWLRRAGEAGNWWAVTDLGNLYDEGWSGVPRDPAEAARWKRRLAEIGDAGAAGWLLYHGEAAGR